MAFGGFNGLGVHDSSTGAVLAALRSVQDGGERGLQRLLQGRAEALVAGARSLNWLPQAPLPLGTSQYAEDLLALLQARPAWWRRRRWLDLKGARRKLVPSVLA